MIFFPEKLDKTYQFEFTQNFEEISIKTKDNKQLNDLLFKADSSKGLIFYLHGNAGSLRTWGEIATIYTNLNYDVFMPDYRGYGKSEGKINSQKQFFNDIQTAYNYLKDKYIENSISILGYSIGTGPAAYLASTNNPKSLILQAPYYSLTDLMQEMFPMIPTFILKYKFETYKYLHECKMPVIIFHGDRDEVVDYKSSLKLKDFCKPADTIIILKDQSHNGISHNKQYLNDLKKVLR